MWQRAISRHVASRSCLSPSAPLPSSALHARLRTATARRGTSRLTRLPIREEHPAQRNSLIMHPHTGRTSSQPFASARFPHPALPASSSACSKPPRRRMLERGHTCSWHAHAAFARQTLLKATKGWPLGRAGFRARSLHLGAIWRVRWVPPIMPSASAGVPCEPLPASRVASPPTPRPSAPTAVFTTCRPR